MTLLVVIPALPVRDIPRAVAFYRDRLGFASRHVDDGMGIVIRDAVEIHLWEANSPTTAGAEPYLTGSASCRIRVTNLRDLYSEYQEQDVVHPNGALASRPWDDDFTILDADGNAIAFCERSASS